jgi:HK97 family phage major capsid protein
MKMKMEDLVAKAVEQARAAKAKGYVVGGGKGHQNADAKKAAAELETKWFKAFAAKDATTLKELDAEIAQQKAADLSGQDTVATDPSEGGFLVPTTVESTIVKKLNETSDIRKYATVISNFVGKLKLGAEDTLVSAYWVAEGDNATLATATWNEVELEPQKAVGFGKFTDEVLTQTVNNPDIRKLVVDQFAEAVRRLEDAAYVGGDGNGKPKGYRTETMLSGHTVTGSGDLLADTMALYRAVPRAYRANANWFVNDVTAGLYDGLKDGNGRPLLDVFSSDVEKIKGRPVGYEPNLPDDEMWFGDFSKYVITDGAGIRVDYGLDGDDFKRSKTSVRVIHYTDGALVLLDAVAKATGLSNAS